MRDALARSPDTGASRALLWCARVGVPCCFVATLLLAGPRALAVTRARFQALVGTAPRGPRVDLDRVGFVSTPKWMQGDWLTAVALDLAPALGGEIGLTDVAGAERLLACLRDVAWVKDAALQRVYPDRLRATFDLRQPVATVVAKQGMVAVDGDGVCLPCPLRVREAVERGDGALPRVVVTAAMECALGQSHPDPGVVAAAAVAREWSADIATAEPSAPALRAIDATNLGYRGDPARWCEVRIALARADGGEAWLAYDHPVGSVAPRVPAPVKRAVLRQLLSAHPGLADVAEADLRFPNRWQQWVRLRPTPP